MVTRNGDPQRLKPLGAATAPAKTAPLAGPQVLASGALLYGSSGVSGGTM
jgi:hypothetical protein